MGRQGVEKPPPVGPKAGATAQVLQSLRQHRQRPDGEPFRPDTEQPSPCDCRSGLERSLAAEACFGSDGHRASGLLTELTVLANVVCILMILFPALPSRVKPI